MLIQPWKLPFEVSEVDLPLILQLYKLRLRGVKQHTHVCLTIGKTGLVFFILASYDNIEEVEW